MSIKQFFCSHIYKEIKSEFLYEKREMDSAGGGGWMLPDIETYRHYASTQKCLKCTRERIVKTRKVVL